MSDQSEIQSIASVAHPKKISFSGGAGKYSRAQPIIRSCAFLEEVAVEFFKLFGSNVKAVSAIEDDMELEFFLIDRGLYNKRADLMLTGRTLVGAPSPKGQLFGTGLMNDRVFKYMKDVIDEERDADVCGAPAATYHNCGTHTPNQYKITFSIDHDLKLPEIMKKVAMRHNLACLLHEKPFAGINGNGRRISWSLLDENDKNLFKVGDTPEENLLFLTLIVSVIQAVHRHSGLLLAVTASAGNEERLGESGAPSAIMSVSLGEQLTKIITAIEAGKTEKGKKRDIADLGVCPLPKFTSDAIDSSNTSPFAFTGDGFEFRMPGSSTDIPTVVTVINTIVADSIKTICDRIKKELSKSKSDKDADPQLSAAVLNVLSAVIKESKSVLFDGDGGDSIEWAKEAQARGLPKVAPAPEALKAFIAPKAVELFGRHKVFSEAELKDLYNARLDQYGKTVDIEIKTLTDIVNTQVLPAAYNYQADIASGLEVLRVLADDMTIEMTEGALEDRKEMFERLTADIYYIRKNLKELAVMADKARGMEIGERAAYLFKEIKPQMDHIRRHVDALEEIMPDEAWPLPKYREMLFIY